MRSAALIPVVMMKNRSMPEDDFLDGRCSTRRVLGVFFLVTVAAAPNAADAAADGIPDPSIATSLPPTLASFGGLRPYLARRGVTFQLNDIVEVFGNPSGGERTGTALDNRLELVIDVDLEKLAGWKGVAPTSTRSRSTARARRATSSVIS